MAALAPGVGGGGLVEREGPAHPRGEGAAPAQRGTRAEHGRVVLGVQQAHGQRVGVREVGDGDDPAGVPGDADRVGR
ncbi:MAG TPA: hypothetical protein VFZ92_31610 [Umezawaea sp.]